MTSEGIPGQQEESTPQLRNAIELVHTETEDIKRIKESGTNLDYLDPSTNIFFCEATCVTHLDEKDKYTEGLYDCVSLLIFAKKNGTSVSLITHFNPKTIDTENERLNTEGGEVDYFEKWLRDYLTKVISDVDPGSVRSYIAGGKEEERFLEFGEDSALAILSSKEDYAYLKKVITEVSYKVTKKSPTIALPPATQLGGGEGYEDLDTRIYVDTQKQKIYIVRPVSVS